MGFDLPPQPIEYFGLFEPQSILNNNTLPKRKLHSLFLNFCFQKQSIETLKYHVLQQKLGGGFLSEMGSFLAKKFHQI